MNMITRGLGDTTPFSPVLKTYEHQLKGIIIEYNKSRALTNINIVGVGNYKARS